MTPATGLVLHFTRCNAPARIEAWAGWSRDVLLPAMREVPGVRAATQWALTQQPTPGMPSVGFSHVLIFEVTRDVETCMRALDEREARLRAANQIDPNHSVMNVDVLDAHGRWNQKPEPDASLKGHILAYVHCNDPARVAEWDRWNDDVHMPDMLGSGAFEAVSRWRRRPRGLRGSQFLTLYDVGPIGVDQAVAKSAAVMPGIVASGRKHACHVGGLTVTLARG